MVYEQKALIVRILNKKFSPKHGRRKVTLKECISTGYSRHYISPPRLVLKH